MSLAVMVMFIAAVIVLVVSVLLVFHPDYEAGPLGVLGLGLLSIAAIARINDGIEHGYVGPRAMLIWVGVAIFLLQLAFRFIRRRRNKKGHWVKHR